jgi:hypothetical protein
MCKKNQQSGSEIREGRNQRIKANSSNAKLAKVNSK